MDCVNKLIDALDHNLAYKKFNDAVKLIDIDENLKIVLTHYPEIIQNVIMKYLTAENYKNEPNLYGVCEAILKLLAKKCYKEGILFEFLEIVETVKDDDIFISILKCLQVVVLSQTEKKSRSLEYCLNSIEDYILTIPLPTDLLKNIEEEEEKLLENDERMQRILMIYMTLDLFYEPVITQIMEKVPKNVEFRSNRFNERQNVLFCFILRLLGKPFFSMDMSNEDTSKAKTYARQVAEHLVLRLFQLHSDVFQLLPYLEIRNRWPPKQKDSNQDDIFLHHDNTPLISLSMLFYLIIAEEIGWNKIPKVYSSIYIFRMTLYAVNTLLTMRNTTYKGLKLGFKLIETIETNLSCKELDYEIHRLFSLNLIEVILFSSKRNRQEGLKLLKSYILKFDTEGRYLLIKNIFKNCQHSGLKSFLIGIYKDTIFQELSKTSTSEFTRGSFLKNLLSCFICNLKGGAQCDIIDSSEEINASLNFLIALLLRDKNNVTGIKDLVQDIQRGFLEQLRVAINLSQAHYLNEIENVQLGKSMNTGEGTVLTETRILNGEPPAVLTKECKLQMLNSALGVFDLLKYLLARCSEIIDQL